MYAGMQMDNKYTVGICTLGCRVNLYESEAIASSLSQKGFLLRDFADVNDVYIINTCTVTSESDRKSRQMIRRAVKRNPNAKVFVCGCYSQLFYEKVREINGVDYIGGTTDKMKIVEKVISLVSSEKKNEPEENIGDPFSAPFETTEATFQDRTRAFLKIEDGCNNKCAYCIIPKARGKVRSKPINDVISEVEKIVRNGYKEIVLTGIETAAYGEGEDYKLIDLLERLENTAGLERIRLGSIEPAYLKKDIIDRLSKLKKTMPHYHLSLQSGTDRTLNQMRRRYNTEMVKNTVEYMKKFIPNVTFGSDFIVGFPGENESDFNNTVEFVESLGILNSHIFSYSVREGTEAAVMDNQISPEIKEIRHKTLENVCNNMKKDVIESFIKMKTPLKVLFEQSENGECVGHTCNFIYVQVKNDKPLNGKIRQVILKKYNEKNGMTEGDLI